MTNAKGLIPSKSKVSKTKAMRDEKETENVASSMYNHDNKTITLNIVSSKGKTPRSIVLDPTTVERLKYSKDKKFSTDKKGYLIYGGKRAHDLVMKTNNKDYGNEVTKAKRLWRLEDAGCEEFWGNGRKLGVAHINSDSMDPSYANLQLVPLKVNNSMKKSDVLVSSSGKYYGHSCFNGEYIFSKK
jgi:hypothetical protein